MQWFIGLNEDCPAFKQYADLAKVALHTGQCHTTLEPHVLYDGGENAFTGWLRDREIPIIKRRTFLAESLEQLSTRKGDPAIATVARGVFLRVELPALRAEIGLDDRVLYTDCDVLFRSDVTADLESLAPVYFSVAGEFEPLDYDNMNTGVMWMNLPILRERDPEFRQFIMSDVEGLQRVAWDQGAYRSFFRSADRQPLWDKLQPELNWKPYWGDYANARIVHFHGPKPFQRNYIDSHYSELKHLTGGCYEELCDLWTQLLHEAQ